MNEITKIENLPVTKFEETWAEMKEKAAMLVRSGFLPVAVNTPEKALAIMLAGRELGIQHMEAFRSIHVIQGKPTISPQLMLALANRTRELEDIIIDPKADKCTVTITRKGRKPHSETFGVPEATRLGLMTKDNYQKQPATMFKWRALAACLRIVFPDVMLGLYTPEEIGADVKVIDDNSMELDHTKAILENPVGTTKLEGPPPGKDDIYEVSSIVFDAQMKTSPKSGKAYYMIQDYKKNNYSFFDTKLFEFAKEAYASKALCVFRYKMDGRWRNLVELLFTPKKDKEIPPTNSEDVGDGQEPFDAEVVD